MVVSDAIAALTYDTTWLQWTLWTLLMSLVVHWLAQNRAQVRSASNENRLRHPTGTLIIGLAGFLLFASIAVVSNVYSNATTSGWTTAVFAGFALLALPVVGDYFAARHEVFDDGLRYGRLLGSGGFIRWSELKRVRFSDSMKWFVLESQSSQVVRLSVMLMGLPIFAQRLLARTPRDVIDRVSLSVLQATADGNPPSVWRTPAS